MGTRKVHHWSINSDAWHELNQAIHPRTNRAPHLNHHPLHSPPIRLTFLQPKIFLIFYRDFHFIFLKLFSKPIRAFYIPFKTCRLFFFLWIQSLDHRNNNNQKCTKLRNTLFLVACTRLYTSLSVDRSVGP